MGEGGRESEARAGPPATVWLTLPVTVTATPEGLWLAGRAVSSESARAHG